MALLSITPHGGAELVIEGDDVKIYESTGPKGYDQRGLPSKAVRESRFIVYAIVRPTGRLVLREMFEASLDKSWNSSWMAKDKWPQGEVLMDEVEKQIGFKLRGLIIDSYQLIEGPDGYTEIIAFRAFAVTQKIDGQNDIKLEYVS